MSAWLVWVCGAGGLAAAAAIGYRIGLGRGQRRERRAQTLSERLQTAVTDLPETPPEHQARIAPRISLRSKPPCLL